MTKEEWDSFLAETVFEERELVAEKLGLDVDEETAIGASLERALAEISNDIADDVRRERETE